MQKLEKAENMTITYNKASQSEEKTFRAFAEEWLSSIQGSVASTTYDRYVEALRRDIFPVYADLPMKEVTSEEMERFIAAAPGLAEKKGRTLRYSALNIVRAVMSNVIRFSANSDQSGGLLSKDTSSYEPLLPSEIEKICFKAKYNHCQEMLSALLFLFCGMRNGELCALSCDDIDLDRMEIAIHSIAHRVSNPDKIAKNKTILVVEEIARKKQKRRVRIPAVLREYIEEFMISGRPLLRNADFMRLDPRTLENRMMRVFDALKLKGLNPERLRMTYRKGKADEQILTNVFLGISPGRPYGGAIDMKWLTDEMTRDLASLRLLIGASYRELGQILGVSEAVYQSMESGEQQISWDEYLTLLFLYHYNVRTTGIVDELGLFPQSLKELLKVTDAT